ncbi:MAG: hypothetical protein JNK87_14950 [Bryobacterales bacterium]|nr:hypothetical protein [Bryobacterales bacterium]
MGNSLSEFLRARKEQSSATTVDWNRKRDQWLEAVRGLYLRVENMLRADREAGVVEVRTREVPVTEQFVGTYDAPLLELRVGMDEVQFLPKGVTVVGAEGRVDLRGDRNTVTLLWEGGDRWTVVLGRVPELEAASLSEDSLRDALQKVMLPVL